MTLKNTFFKIKDVCPTATGADYTLAFEPEHFIYQAHFPGNPITTGVCIIQIVKELSIEMLQRKLFIKKLNNVKFLNVINPVENKEVIFSISISSAEDNVHKINAVISNDNQQFAKLSMLFITQ
jgi:3-hydroxyacyl-[acyl-carrier-protein] dehydratase